MNRKLQTEGAIDLTYEAFSRGVDVGEDEYIGYYDFLKIIGPNSISWPK